MTGFSPYSYRDDPFVPGFADDKPVIVLDGYCALCARSAQFVLARDPDGRLRMTAAQSSLGEALFRHYGLKHGDYDTVLLIDEGQLRVRSDAALRILEVLGHWRPLTFLARLVPRVAADAIYNIVAKNRIRIWGARATCFVPEPRYRDRFI